MRILIISPYYDPAQMGVRLCRLLNEHTGHEAKSIAGIRTYFPSGSGEHKAMLDEAPDLLMQKKCEACDGAGETGDEECGECKSTGIEDQGDVCAKAARMMEEADVLHFNQFDWTYHPGGEAGATGEAYCFPMDWERHMKEGQKLVFHGHGGAWLLDPGRQIRRCENAGATMVTCSPIDRAVVPEIMWMPNFVPVSDEAYKPVERDFGGRLRASMVSCAPLYKGAGIAEYVFEYLGKFGYDVSFEVVQGMPLVEALRTRAPHHFTVDNWTQGFHGLAGLEGLCLGHVVIARLDPMARMAWDGVFEEPIPLEDVRGMDDCAKRVRHYHGDRAALEEKCARGREWMERNYSERRLAEIWSEFYAEVAA